MAEDKPTWTLVAHMGIVKHNRVLVSLAKLHFINGVIKAQNKLYINLVRDDMLPEVDISGLVSAAKKDKPTLFVYSLRKDKEVHYAKGLRKIDGCTKR